MTRAIPADVDVLVAGYGPVGAAIAGLLGQYGVRTLVIDKAADVWTAPRAIALDDEALRVLQLVGLDDDAFERIVIPYVRMLCPHVGEFGRIDTSGTIDGHPKLVTFYQPELERALRRRATAHVSVTAATGVALESFVDEGDGVRATLRTTGGAEHAVRARYLVAADGASSRVRTAIGQEFRGKTYAEDWLIVDARNAPGDLDHVEFLCDPRRPTPHMIAPGGRTRWEFMLHAGETREEMEEDATIHRLLAPWSNGHDLVIERKAVYRFHARSCDRYSRGRVFLAGDAAHVTPPFAGQGLVAGLRDAANLAWKLAWVVGRGADPAILETYDQERRPHATKMIALARFMGRLIMPRNAAAAVVVHGALKVARRIPGVAPFIDGTGLKPKPEFEAGLFVRGGRGPLRRGGAFPQLLVRSPDGVVQRSDDVLGAHLVLVGLGADPSTRLGPEAERRWAELGGATLQIVSPDQRSDELGHAHAMVGDALPPRLLRQGWCVVVRPDRTILHDGPANCAERIVEETIAMLTAGGTRTLVTPHRARAGTDSLAGEQLLGRADSHPDLTADPPRPPRSPARAARARPKRLRRARQPA